METNNSNNNKGSFKTPKDYFENFEDRLMDSLATDTADTDILSQKKDIGFKTPDGYLESFEGLLLKKLEIRQKPAKVVSLFSRKNMIYMSGIAAMIAIIISISIGNKQEHLDFDTITITDIQEYLDEENVAFSDTEIAALFDDEIHLVNTFNENEISDNELENYLFEENLEDEIIYVE